MAYCTSSSGVLKPVTPALVSTQLSRQGYFGRDRHFLALLSTGVEPGQVEPGQTLSFRRHRGTGVAPGQTLSLC